MTVFAVIVISRGVDGVYLFRYEDDAEAFAAVHGGEDSGNVHIAELPLNNAADTQYLIDAEKNANA